MKESSSNKELDYEGQSQCDDSEEVVASCIDVLVKEMAFAMVSDKTINYDND